MVFGIQLLSSQRSCLATDCDAGTVQQGSKAANKQNIPKHYTPNKHVEVLWKVKNVTNLGAGFVHSPNVQTYCNHSYQRSSTWPVHTCFCNFQVQSPRLPLSEMRVKLTEQEISINATSCNNMWYGSTPHTAQAFPKSTLHTSKLSPVGLKGWVIVPVKLFRLSNTQ